MKFPRLLLVIPLLLLLFSLPGWPARSAQGAAAQSVSTVQIAPVSTCCQLLNNYFTVNVILTLARGESINGFDVRINYTNPHTNYIQGVLKAVQIEYSSNIFASYQNNVLVDCIDGISVQGANGCPTGGPDGDSPAPGQFHLAEGIIGQTVSTGGLLFSATFQVTGLGQSIFTMDRANLVNPHGDASNPQAIIPVYIPVVKQDAVFGNTGVVAFFNYQPHDTTITPGIIPNQPVDFDATPSFVETSPSSGFRLYSWNFGDKTPVMNVTDNPFTSHIFGLPGNYSVSLTVWDSSNENGTVTRTVNVMRALGNLLLTVEDELGTVLRATAVVRVFNSSTSGLPFITRLTDNSGDVLFVGFLPSDYYYVTFSGATVENSSKTESVRPGFTTMDTVHLTLKPSPTDNSGLIYIGSLLAGLGIVTGAIIYKRRSMPSVSARRTGRRMKSRGSRHS